MTRSPRQTARMTVAATLALTLLAGCDENGKFKIPMPNAGPAATTAGSTKSTKLVERDVEAPEVFSATDQGLWDGRPSLGGVWVAHPDVTEPERVIIRNEANGKFVIGALFRKERDLPGPKLQISSDAAAALSILAGAPAPLNVTALRREETEEAAPGDETATGTVDAPAKVSQTSLDPIAAAGAAIDAAPTPSSPPKPTKPRAASSLNKPFVQLGIFSIEGNATRVAKQMRSAGMVPSVKQSEINGKPFWRVLVGPAMSKSELNNLIKAIKAEGFSDAYAVTN
ncbi:SPOR domain-containing protein [Sulfitobacter sp. M57]|nr:SPOR domain-containing protein [Sulfitobacter sp. KE5]MDF3431622.1 SPOR domain-containing protein [Sulfitobacter sp. KE42]MDF3457263.1 SPOR domain-containing protein [Sulfitobacter sp. S74]MDF3465065.1 SPOR domain-containing protein [Sulfitobacter sp. M05]MDF3472704.1 SPOR domain-containing protein [Sulfitobacter sp. M48]MDF3476612.1 SPOR domain-containing protein [Sulfitobacter sp. M53]MDF3503924.1 SPOR domain-containing protein [Sulfitobacter sp. M54]MDF3507823.1 SPOR domain-containing 